MKRIVFILAAVILLGGCGTKYQVNPGFAEHEMNYARKNHEAYCNRMAHGQTPPPSMIPVPPQGYSASYSGTGYAQYGGNYTYSGNVYIDNSRAHNQAVNQNAMMGLAYIFSVEARKDDCMRSLGWRDFADLSDMQANRYPNLKKEFSGILGFFKDDGKDAVPPPAAPVEKRPEAQEQKAREESRPWYFDVSATGHTKNQDWTSFALVYNGRAAIRLQTSGIADKSETKLAFEVYPKRDIINFFVIVPIAKGADIPEHYRQVSGRFTVDGKHAFDVTLLALRFGNDAFFTVSFNDESGIKIREAMSKGRFLRLDFVAGNETGALAYSLIGMNDAFMKARELKGELAEYNDLVELY